MDDTHAVRARSLSGTGLQITRAWQVRVKNVEVDRRAIGMRAGKGRKGGAVMWPVALAPLLTQQLQRLPLSWPVDRRTGHSDVFTAMGDTHGLDLSGGAVRSPLDALAAAA